MDYILLRTGISFGPNDNIQRFHGTNQQTAVFAGLFSENPNGYFLSDSYLTIPAAELDWTVTDPHGRPTKLAAVDGAGLVAATGAADGDVLVTATLKNNPDISGTRVIAVRNQGVKDAYKMIQAENYDAASTSVDPVGTWGFGGNEFGMQIPMPANSVWTFKNVDFGTSHPDRFAVRLAPGAGVTTAALEVWADAPTAGAGGRLLATVNASTSGSAVTYSTFLAPVNGPISGVHDIVLIPAAAVNVNWFTFGR